VLRVDLGDARALLQYVGRHRLYGDMILVGPTYRGVEPIVDASSFVDGYVTFYPARLAAREGLIERIGHLAPPPLPVRLRRVGVRVGQRVETWVIEDPSGEILRRDLTEEERRIPIVQLINHEALVIRIRRGWRPETEGLGDTGTDDSPPPQAPPTSPATGRTVHYFYAPEQVGAERLAHALAAEGLEASVRRSAAGRDWLVTAGTGADQHLDDERLRSLATALGCEYDGSETLL
jgi:hypothetical protein